MVESEEIPLKVNRNNQLLVKVPQEKKSRLLRGEFKTDDRNRLLYYVNEPNNWHRKYNLPDKIVFEGRWELNSNHDLVLNLEKKEKFRRESLVLKGSILETEGNFLIFQIKSKLQEEITKICHLKLEGFWRSDKFNRITFMLTGKEKPDILVFRNTWQLNKSKEIIYNYEKLATKRKHTLTFKGYWQISSSNRLNYVLEVSKKSFFEFHVNLKTPNLKPAKGKIKYRIGIGLRKKREEKLLVFSGEWKFSRQLGIIFEMDYGKDKINRIYFSSVLNLAQKDKLIFSLYNSLRQPLGMSITFKRTELPQKDFEYFLRLKKQSKAIGFELGGRSRF